MALQQTTIPQTTLDARLQRRLRQQLRIYQELKAQETIIQMALEKAKAEIEAVREEVGDVTVRLDGFTVTQIVPSRKNFDKKKFVAEGGNLDLYNQCQVEVPVKPYTKISVPGATASEE